MSTHALEIVSGGQAGVDRGALDAALEAGTPCRGFCPAGRRAEDGPIPARYPLTELDDRAYAARTEANVRLGDATLILCPGKPTGGTALTLRLARRHCRPVLVVDAERSGPDDALPEVRRFLIAHAVTHLNVAGPRASGWPRGAAYARRLVAGLLTAPVEERQP